MKMLTTTFTGNKKATAARELELAPDPGIENNVINLYPEFTYQTFEGFGGAATESAGYIYSLMPDALKREMLETYFGDMNYRLVRVHMDSCDFSLGHYEAMSDPADLEIRSFSFERTEKYILPLLDDIRKVLGRPPELMLSPWSPPAFMKTNGERDHGGRLREEYRGFWARYICRYISEFQKHGYPVKRISLQNEPNAVQTWDSCVYSAHEEKAFLKTMHECLMKNGMGEIEIFGWDHNKERLFERACGLIDDDTANMLAGLAFHWYSGDHFDTLGLTAQKFPGKKLIMSEACIEYYKYSSDDYLKNAQRYAHEIIGDLNGGMSAFYDWNLVLDERGGPNHVQNFCDAPFMFDTANARLIERNTLAYIGHFSRYIKPGAVRIGHSLFTDKLEATAFKNPDGRIALVILNRTEETFDVCLRLDGRYADFAVEPASITSLIG